MSDRACTVCMRPVADHVDKDIAAECNDLAFKQNVWRSARAEYEEFAPAGFGPAETVQAQ